MAFSKVSTFIYSFLLQPIDALNRSSQTQVKSTSNMVNDRQPFVLTIHCPLYSFIQQQMRERGTITSIAHHNSTHFRLVEPIGLTDDFGPWQYDHWQGLFDLELRPHGDNTQFPERWCLADKVTIHCRIEINNSGEKTLLPSYMDRPRTGTLDAFIHDVCARENNGQNEAWLKALKQEDIFNFEHLTNLNQSEWNRIHKLSVNAKRILKAAVDRERTNTAGERRRQVINDSIDENNEQMEPLTTIEDSSISDSELFAKMHLIKLFVWYKLRDHRDVRRHGALARLEMKCLDTAFEEMQSEGFADDEMIKTELNTPHKPVDKQLVKPPRGLIMYGPPGTGKSDILSKLAKKLGIIMVGPPLAAGELNRPLVGESERILIALCLRCYQVPYAMCCISIDEIDSLAPKRDEDSSEGKVDKISVLLSLIEGIKDVPNLMILSATNRLHMMDEAFLRRMSGKFFVGRPSSDARTSMLRNIPCWAIEPELLERLSIATTNFSGAAVKALTRAITVKCMTIQRSNPNYQIDEIEALKMADRTAQQYQIFIGSETLPRLLLRNKFADSHHPHTYQSLSNAKYTGRIIVNLHNRHIRIEVSEQGRNVNKGQPSIIEHELNPNESNVQTLLERLTAYGKSRNVQLLQLIDLNLLASQGAYDEKKVYETLKDRYDECIAYTRSMIVYDLDELVGVNKSETDSNMGRSNTQFPRTRQEEEELEIERHLAEDLLKCVKCKDFYIENENKMGNCVHHDGFVYDNEAADLTIYTPSEVARLYRKLEHKIIKYPDRREEFERQTTKFKWICCDETFTMGHTGGCKRGKHGFSLNDNDSSSRQLTNGNSNRLNQATIEQWEDACRANEEYNEKWLILAKEY
ncbi:unnamed protein product [Rotaria sordida]|uniref:AAA+ ATPase domain-containing protein n=1 Tax=Rotaria sordida TaxID=392033 RepID=A0A819IV28_9BILA|nr:unnamed protein product [Rotaria sordida]